MLISNSTGQILVPYEKIVSVVLQPETDAPNLFYKVGSQAEQDDCPTCLTITCDGGVLTFRELYGNREKAKQALVGFKCAHIDGKAYYQFPSDDEYAEQRKAAKLAKEHENRLKKPFYSMESRNGK